MTRRIPFLILLLAVVLPFAALADLPKKRKAPPLQKVAPPVAVQEAPPVQPLSEEQLAFAQRVETGQFPCELGASISVLPDPAQAGRFVLALGKDLFYMVPVPSQTGALRLEDGLRGAVWLQLGNKSMLMSQQLGRRLADGCTSAQQVEVAKSLMNAPASNLLDAPPIPIPVTVQTLTAIPLSTLVAPLLLPNL